MDMRLAGLTALLLAGAMIGSAVAEAIPLPPKRDIGPQATQSTPIRPPGPIGAAPAAPARPAAPNGPNGPAAKMSQQQLLDRVNAYLSSVQTLVGNFVQVGPDGSRSEGDLYIQKPGKVRFEYNPPSVIEVVADGNSVAVRNSRLATQDLYPLSQTPLRLLLADHIDLARDTTLVSVSADDVFVTVVVEETQPLVGTHRLMLMFGAKDFQLRQWTVTDPQGYDTTVAVYNLDATKRPDPNLFRIDYTRDRN
jgi:outer membrane lipoprotein-sorting protein